MKVRLLVLFILCTMASPAMAAVIDVPDVMGLGAFQDTTTGLTWLDQDNFYGLDYAQTLTANPIGFHLATFAEVQQLFLSLPGLGDPGFRTTDCVILGATCVTGFFLSDLRGWYDDQIFLAGMEGEIQRSFFGTLTTQSRDSSSQIPPSNGNSGLGAWVVADSPGMAVPEPSSLLLLGGALFGLIGFRKRF